MKKLDIVAGQIIKLKQGVGIVRVVTTRDGKVAVDSFDEGATIFLTPEEIAKLNPDLVYEEE